MRELTDRRGGTSHDIRETLKELNFILRCRSLDISLTEISKKSGIGWGTINRWKRSEVDRFDASVLSALCEYFECGVGDLIEYVPDVDNE